MFSKSRIHASFLTLLAAIASFALPAAAEEFSVADVLGAAAKKYNFTKNIVGTKVSSDHAKKNEASIAPSLKKQVFESLNDYFFQEDEGRSCRIKEDDVWGHEITNIVHKEARVLSLDVNTLVNGWSGNCAGRMRFSCTTVFTREKGKLRVDYSECAEDE